MISLLGVQRDHGESAAARAARVNEGASAVFCSAPPLLFSATQWA